MSAWPPFLLVMCAVTATLLFTAPVSATEHEPAKTICLTYREIPAGKALAAPDTAKVIITVAPHRTTLSQGDEETIIDYLNQEVIRQKSQPATAIHYPLRASRSPEARQKVDEVMMARLGSYRILSSREGGSYHGRPVTETVIRFGMGLIPARTAAPMQYDFFGQRFGERTLHIEASMQVPYFAELARRASEHREAVRANPLLLQLDLINLIPLAGGLPLSLREQTGKILQFLELQPVEDGR